MGADSELSQFSANGQKLPYIGGRAPIVNNSEMKQITTNLPPSH